jgi:hypothetical protein
MLLCSTVAVWVAAAGFKAKQCLDGQLDLQRSWDWRGATSEGGASINELGCEVTTPSGQIVLVPISAPPFEVGVAAVLGFVVLGAVALVVFVRRAQRPPDPMDVA